MDLQKVSMICFAHIFLSLQAIALDTWVPGVFRVNESAIPLCEQKRIFYKKMNTNQNVNLNETRIVVSLEILKKKSTSLKHMYNAREIVVTAMHIFCLNNLSISAPSVVRKLCITKLWNIALMYQLQPSLVSRPWIKWAMNSSIFKFCST